MVKREVTGRYNYLSPSGKLLYWKERVEPGRDGRPKEFFFYHGIRQSGRGCEPVLMYLPEVLASKAVIICEGEKKAYLVRSWGLVATTFDSGANSKISPEMVEALTGKRIAILRDNDAPGLKYAEMIGKAMIGKAESIRVVLLPNLPEKGDVCDWKGGDRDKLLAIIKATPEWVAPPEEVKPERRKLAKGSAVGDITPDMIEAAKAYPIDQLIEFTLGKASCFKHDDKTPSLAHYKAKNRAHCFSCSLDLDAPGLLMERDGMTFPEAVKTLCGVSG